MTYRVTDKTDRQTDKYHKTLVICIQR